MTTHRVLIKYHVVMFDAADLMAQSSFWADVLGGEVKQGDGWHLVYVDGTPVVGVQFAPNHTPPEWPNGAPQQIHLDLEVEDIAAAHEEVLSLGARLLKSAPIDSHNGFQVYADPAGHPFCLCWTKAG
jgi:catechol 2,3-dioxygenase-like lactoylglutathione lyase family enzyme